MPNSDENVDPWVQITTLEQELNALQEKYDQQQQELLAWQAKEEQYHALFEHSTNAIFLLDSHTGRYLDANSAAETLTGYSRLELRQLTTSDVTPTGAKHRLAQLKRLADRSYSFDEVTYVRPDGTTRYAELSVVNIDGGKLFGVAVDVTERRQREKEMNALLRINKALIKTIALPELLQIIIDSAVHALELETGAIYIVEGETLFLGATKPRLSLEAPPEFRRTNIILHPHIQKVISSQKTLYIQDTELVSFSPEEAAIVKFRGLRSLLYVPLVVQQKVVGVMIMGTINQTQEFSTKNIRLCETFSGEMALAIENSRLYERLVRYTEELEHRVEERSADLLAANAELRKLSRAKDQFVSNVSHELRTPITSLKTRYHLIEHFPEQLKKQLPTIKRETDRLERIIDDLLQLSRFDQQARMVDMKPLDLTQLVELMISDRIPVAIQQGVSIKLDVTDSPLLILGDGGLITQVFSILLTNAINYTPAEGIIIISTDSVNRDGVEWARIRVNDTGPGIPIDEQEHIFKRFYRGKVGQESGKSGTGLGLAIAKEIIELHDGQIEVTSNKSIPGTEFVIFLPM